MKQENTLQVQDMIELENWLIENENKTLNLSEWIKIFSKFSEEKRNYIIMAKILPQKEIEKAIEYYDGHNFPIIVDKGSFINNLSKKYRADNKLIIERIIQVRMIKQHKKTEIKVKKRKK